jgi:hypothetical protein
MNSTSHITQMLKGKRERLELCRKNQCFWILLHYGVEVNLIADLQAKKLKVEKR